MDGADCPNTDILDEQPAGALTHWDNGLSKPTVPSVRMFAASLKRTAMSAAHSLDPSSIIESKYRNRSTITPESVATLKAQIEANGQLQPILAREILGNLNKFEIVYGNRRLAAIRLIPGMKVVALIRNMTDEQAIIAQGQENSTRYVRSWAELALYFGQLERANCTPQTIQESLAINATQLLKFRRVLAALGTELIYALAPANHAGSKKWLELADLVSDNISIPFHRKLLDFVKRHPKSGTLEALQDVILEVRKYINGEKTISAAHVHPYSVPPRS